MKSVFKLAKDDGDFPNDLMEGKSGFNDSFRQFLMEQSSLHHLF
jgi:hypothetical protein